MPVTVTTTGGTTTGGTTTGGTTTGVAPQSRHSLPALLSRGPGLLLLVLVGLLGWTADYQSDTYWHLKTGQLILSGGSVPAVDWYTYPSSNEAWIDLHWLWQVSAYLVWARLGTNGLILLKCAFAAGTFGLMGAHAGRPRHLFTLALLPAVCLFAQRYVVRPEMVTLLLTAATLAVWAAAGKRPWVVWCLVPIQLVWVNSHALFVLGLVISLWHLGGIWAARLPLRWLASLAPQPPPGRASLAVAASGLVCLVNPYGVAGALFPFTLFTRVGPGETKQFYQQLCGEFYGMGELIGTSTVWGHAEATFLILQALVVLGSFVVLATRRRLSLSRLGLTVAFGYLAWQAWRNGPLFAVVGGVVACQNLADYFQLSPPEGRGARAELRGAAACLLLLAALCAAVPSNLFARLIQPTAPRWFAGGERPFTYAHAVARWLGREGLPRQAYCSHFGHAATYIFHNGPESKVFADGRLEVNRREVLEDYLALQLQLIKHDPAAEQRLRRYGDGRLPALMLDVEYFAPFADQMLWHPRWRPVFSDGVAIAFLPEDEAARLEIPAVDRAGLKKYLEMVFQLGSVRRVQRLRNAPDRNRDD